MEQLPWAWMRSRAGFWAGVCLLGLLTPAWIFSAEVRPELPRLVLYSEPVPIPERTPILSQVALADGQRFRFLPPPGWRVEGNAKTLTITLTEPDLGSAIRFRILPRTDAPEGTPSEWDPEAVRKELVGRFPEATVLEEGTGFAAGQTGPVCDFLRRFGEGLRLRSRIVVVPYIGGRLEFELSASPEKFAANLSDFNAVLGSVRVEQRKGAVR